MIGDGKLKLFELLETAKTTGDIIVRKLTRKGCPKYLRYFEQYKQFMSVKENGELILAEKPRYCSIELSEDLLSDDFYLMPCKTDQQRLYDLTDKHLVTIEDLETLVEIYDNGIFTDGIVKAVLHTYPYSSYASHMVNKTINEANRR